MRGALIPKTDAMNEAGGVAYALVPKQALAQYAATGCLNSTYYASADDQLQKVLALTKEVDAEFIAKTALYARSRGAMKDVPALLLAVLSLKSPDIFKAAFPKIVDNGRMLRNFVQIIRSGALTWKAPGDFGGCHDSWMERIGMP